MLSNVYTKTILDRWKGMIIGAVSLALMLLFGMAVYRDIDISIYTGMPAAMRAILNISENSDASGLAYAAMYSSYGALTLAALALSMGAASIAGEERGGTMGLLLGNPVSRTRVLVSKAASMVSLTAAGALILWGGGLLVPRILSVDVGGMQVGALVLHIFVISVFYGFLAMAIGAWTGNRSLASGSTAGFLVVSFIAAGLFPLVSGWENVARAFPWHYYDAGQPLLSGIDWAGLAILLAGIVVLSGAALVGVNRRDLKESGVAVTLLDRLRSNRHTQKVIEKIAGSARVSRIAAKTISDHQTLTIVVGYVVLLMGLAMGPFYLLIDDLLVDFARGFPRAILAMVGFADMTTPEGWLQTEVFSMTVPVAMIVVTAVVGAKALAGEEADRTMGLLLGNPVSRTRIVVEKTAAMVSLAAIIGVLTFMGTMLGSLMAGLGVGYLNVAATTVLATLLALLFGALALAISAATGRVKAASYGTAGAALAFYILNAFLPLSDHLAGYAKWSPFYYYLTSDPLNHGLNWGHAGILTASTVVLLVAAAALFDRRDLRQNG